MKTSFRRFRILIEPSSTLIEAAEEMSFNWPEFLPVAGIKAGMTQMAVASLLFAGLVVVGRFLFLSFGS